MSDLRTFLLARIDDDEQSVDRRFDGIGSPSRVLVECAAKLAVVERHFEYAHEGFCDYCFNDYPCADLRTLGAIYDQHPDYREEWRP